MGMSQLSLGSSRSDWAFRYDTYWLQGVINVTHDSSKLFFSFVPSNSSTADPDKQQDQRRAL